MPSPAVVHNGIVKPAAARERAAYRLLALTREMCTLGEAGEWTSFAERETERQNLSQELFSTPVPDEAAPVVADCTRRALELDETLLALVHAHRNDAAQALEGTERGRQAADAYRRYSR